MRLGYDFYVLAKNTTQSVVRFMQSVKKTVNIDYKKSIIGRKIICEQKRDKKEKNSFAYWWCFV